MSTRASTWQAAFAAALKDPAAPCPAVLCKEQGREPAARFAIHRNNRMHSLIEALADNFPVTQRLVGAEFFAAMAAEFIAVQPPRSPVLALYGGALANFIADFPPTAGLPWLPDMARLEFARQAVLHAADVMPLSRDALSTWAASAQALPTARLRLHPALRLLQSRWAVASLWLAHQPDACADDAAGPDATDCATAIAGVDLAQGEAVVLTRPGLWVVMQRLQPAEAGFLAALLAGLPLLTCAQRALVLNPHFALDQALAQLVAGQAIIGIDLPTEGTP